MDSFFYLDRVVLVGEFIDVGHTLPVPEFDPGIIRTEGVKIRASLIPIEAAALDDAFQDLLTAYAPDLKGLFRLIGLTRTDDHENWVSTLCRYPAEGRGRAQLEMSFDPDAYKEEVALVYEAAEQIVDASVVAERHPDDMG